MEPESISMEATRDLYKQERDCLARISAMGGVVIYTQGGERCIYTTLCGDSIPPKVFETLVHNGYISGDCSDNMFGGPSQVYRVVRSIEDVVAEA